MNTLQQVKDNYYSDLAFGIIERMSLDEYVRTYYVLVHELTEQACCINLIGYERQAH